MFIDEIEKKKNKFDPRNFLKKARFVMACTRFTMDSVLDSTQKQEKKCCKNRHFSSALNDGQCQKIIELSLQVSFGGVEKKKFHFDPRNFV